MQTEATRIEHGPIVMDLLKRQVLRDGKSVLLQPREFRLLEELLREGGKVVTRTMLLERVWNYHFDPQTNIVETHISRLRSKLNEGSRPDVIETVRGVGYRMADNA
jgi:two-component system OmpR family response regulator